jgi:hypothetical protein
LQELKSSEVTDFRWKMKNFVENVVHERENKTWLEKIVCLYPPRLSIETGIPSYLKGELMMITVKFHDSNEVTVLLKSQFITKII